MTKNVPTVLIGAAIMFISLGGASGSTRDLPESNATGVTAAAVRQLQVSAPSSQSARLRDGRVDESEYLASARDMYGCVRAKYSELGYRSEVRGGQLTVDRFKIDYSIRVYMDGKPPLDPDRIASIEDACRQRELTRVELAYQLRLLATPDLVRSAAAGLRSCLEANGARASTQAESRASVLAEAAAAPDRAQECLGAWPAASAQPASYLQLAEAFGR